MAENFPGNKRSMLISEPDNHGDGWIEARERKGKLGYGVYITKRRR